MPDAWVSECVPCKWIESGGTQDDAIRRAEDHAFAVHRDVSPTERANQFIGHVQFRAPNAIAVQQSPQLAPAPDSSAAPAAESPQAGQPAAGTETAAPAAPAAESPQAGQPAAGTETAAPPADTGTAPNP